MEYKGKPYKEVSKILTLHLAYIPFTSLAASLRCDQLNMKVKIRSTEMETSQIHEEIREINLGYMLLAQRLLREDKVTAMYRLGISEDAANILENLTSSQLLKMANSNMLLCRFRFDDKLLAEILSNHGRDRF